MVETIITLVVVCCLCQWIYYRRKKQKQLENKSFVGSEASSPNVLEIDNAKHIIK